MASERTHRRIRELEPRRIAVAAWAFVALAVAAALQLFAIGEPLRIAVRDTARLDIQRVNTSGALPRLYDRPSSAEASRLGGEAYSARTGGDDAGILPKEPGFALFLKDQRLAPLPATADRAAAPRPFRARAPPALV